jgi:hypothetical protein
MADWLLSEFKMLGLRVPVWIPLFLSALPLLASRWALASTRTINGHRFG